MTSRQIYVRTGVAGDLDKILSFYSVNAHPNIDRRKSEAITDAIYNHNAFLVEDVHGNILGASVSYILSKRFREIGSTRMIVSGGFRLLELIVSLQVLAHLARARDSAELVTNVRFQNASIIRRLVALGWVPFAAPLEVVALHQATTDARDHEPCWWAYFPAAHAERCREMVRQATAGPLAGRRGRTHSDLEVFITNIDWEQA
jgi:uncharacterized membrane protein